MTLKYQVGQPLFGDNPVLPHGMYYRYQDREHLSMLVMPESSSMLTCVTFLYDRAEFALTIEENIIFFLARFGRGHWRRAAYYWHFVPENERGLPKEIERLDGTAELQILAIDGTLGCIQGIRKVALSPKFTTTLHRAIEQQASFPRMTKREFQILVDRILNKHPRPKDLVRMARAKMVDVPTPPTWKIQPESKRIHRVQEKR